MSQPVKILVNVDDLKFFVARAIEEPRWDGERKLGIKLRDQILEAERADSR